MTYEAYEEPARRVMAEIVAEARRRWPDVERVALLHRVGELALSEPSVAVAVSSPHRDAAFDAARYCIDTLKETVPIWKQEHWSAGSDWALGEQPIRPVGCRRSSHPDAVRSRYAHGLLVVRRPRQRGRHHRDPGAQPAAVLDGAQHRGVRARPARARTRTIGAPASTGRVRLHPVSRSRDRPRYGEHAGVRALAGIILNEPTVIALNSRTQDVLAMGQEAWQMIGRTPGYIVAVRRCAAVRSPTSTSRSA